MSEFKFGLCNHCKTWTTLRDGLCLICSKDGLPEFFKELFNNKKE